MVNPEFLSFLKSNSRRSICSDCSKIEGFLPYILPDGTHTCIHLFESRLWSQQKSNKHFPRNLTAFKKCKHYAVTLTTLPGQPLASKQVCTVLKKYLKSKQFEPTHDWLACLEHPDTNAHVHLYAGTTKYVPAKDVLKLNKARVDVKRLKTPVELAKWQNYIRSMNKDDPNKVVFKTFSDVENYLSK